MECAPRQLLLPLGAIEPASHHAIYRGPVTRNVQWACHHTCRVLEDFVSPIATKPKNHSLAPMLVHQHYGLQIP